MTVQFYALFKDTDFRSPLTRTWVSRERVCTCTVHISAPLLQCRHILLSTFDWFIVLEMDCKIATSSISPNILEVLYSYL